MRNMLVNSSEAKNELTYFHTGTLNEFEQKAKNEFSEIGGAA